MRSGVLAGLCVAVVVLCVYLPQPCEAEWGALVGPIVSKLSSLWKSGKVNFMGRTCQYNYRPTVNKWKLYYKGKFWCPGWTPITGRSRTKSRSGSVRDAAKSYVRQCFARGYITEQDASRWLKG